MTYTALIAFAPITTPERVNGEAFKRPGRQLYDAGALTFMPGQTTAPVLVGHDHDRVIGTVDTLVRHEQIDGPWLCAIAKSTTAPPGWSDTPRCRSPTSPPAQAATSSGAR